MKSVYNYVINKTTSFSKFLNIFHRNMKHKGMNEMKKENKK